MTAMPQRIGIIGLGYVGLQLAAGFGRHIPTVGFDIDGARVDRLRQGIDQTGEVGPDRLAAAVHLVLSAAPGDLVGLDVYIVAVPTPVDAARRPDLSPLVSASEIVARALRASAEADRRATPPIVVFESTVYPGCTEDVCAPLIERISGLTRGRDFKIGYSPERINPADEEHTLERITKIVAGQDQETTDTLAALYGSIVTAGIYRAPDIKTAEAAKVIENIQRDLNIALMNELALLFHRLGLDTREVLSAARTKWNFLPFQPGLVGGHCIPVDPYYLTHKAQEAGFHPEVILAGRRTNDSMGHYVAQQTLRLLNQSGRPVHGARVLVLGAAFKPDVRDLRNTRVVDVARELQQHGAEVMIHDPLVEDAALTALGLQPVSEPFAQGGRYDAVVIAVPHRTFHESGTFTRMLTGGVTSIIVDVPGVLERHALPSGMLYWRL